MHSHACILLVEDDAIIALAERAVLQRHGYRVIVAHSGAAAIEIASATTDIDLILMDINLGSGIDGTVAAERILANRDLPLIFLSSHTEREVVERTEGITSYGYIVKNSGETVLLASINMAFRLFAAKVREAQKDASIRGHLALQRALVDAASRFLDGVGPPSDETMQAVLGDFARCVAADRAYTFEYRFGEGIAVNTQEYCAPGIEPQIDLLQDLPLEMVSDALEQHRQGRPHVVPDVLALPAGNLRAVLEPQGVRTLITVPIMRGTECTGCVGFDFVHGLHECSETETSLLTVFARLLASAQQRARIEEQLMERERQFRRLVEDSNSIIVRVNHDGILTYVNPATERIFGYRSDEIVGRNILGTIIPATDSTGTDHRAIIADVVAHPERYVHHQNENITKTGERLWVSWTNRVIREPDGSTHVLSIGQDMTEQKRAHDNETRTLQRVQALASTLQYQGGTTHDYLDHALEQALALTESSIGYIFLYDEETRRLTVHAWSKNAMHECTIVEPETCYELDRTGIWGEAVRQRKPIVLNDFAAEHPLKKGYPEGHVKLSRFLTVPVTSGDRIVAVVGVANRVCPYNEADVAQLSLFIHSVWRSIEARTSQEERKRLEHRFETVIETTAAGIVLLDRDGRIVHINRSVLELFGAVREELIGRHVSARDWGVIHPDRRPLAPDEFPSARTLATGESCENVLMGVVRANGDTRWITVTTRPIVDPAVNRPDGVVISFADVTPNETAAEALREREEFYRAVFQKNRAIKVLFDPETGRIEDINDAACSYYGYSREQMLTMVMWDINTMPRDELLQKMARSKAGKEMVFQFQHRLADGSIRDVEVFSGPVPMQGRTLIHAIIQDVSERVRAEQAVAGLLREKDLLLRETHHRIKNNLALVQSMLSIQAANAENEHDTGTLSDAARRIQAMASLYDKLYRSDQHHQLDLAVYLPPLVQEIMALFPDHSEVGARTTVASMVLPAKTLSSLGIVINELITNSMKHAFNHTKSRTENNEKGTITIEARLAPNGAELIYRDNGPGLPAEFADGTDATFGFTLLNAMIAQIGGALTVLKPTYGLEMVISFPLPAESR